MRFAAGLIIGALAYPAGYALGCWLGHRSVLYPYTPPTPEVTP